MRIGMLLPGNFALAGAGNGVRVQAEQQALALEAAGHAVVRLNPWQVPEMAGLDLVHFYVGGYAHFRLHQYLPNDSIPLVFAPIIDSNEPNWRYRIAAQLGRVIPKIHTIPAVFAEQAKRSRLVIVRSEHERRRMVDGLGVDPKKVVIVLNGVNSPTDADPTIARAKFDLPDAYLLHVSSYTQPRKNVVRLIEAVGPTGLPLVVAGSAKPGRTLERIRALVLQYPQIKLLDFVDPPTLWSLYAGARVFCLPSIHEGTGLVALEAGVCDTGVVITRHGGPVDYFAGHARYVEPTDAADIRSKIRQAWDQPHAKALAEHIRTHLSWRRSAAALVQAYEAVI